MFILIGAFLLSLGLPQVGTLRHDHPGGDHFHIHPELVVFPSPPSHSYAHNQQHASAHSHAHIHSYPYPHPHHHHEPERHVVAHHGPHRPPHDMLIPKTATSALAYENLLSAEKGHWHLRINLHHASSPYRGVLASSPSRPVFSDFRSFVALHDTVAHAPFPRPSPTFLAVFNSFNILPPESAAQLLLMLRRVQILAREGIIMHAGRWMCPFVLITLFAGSAQGEELLKTIDDRQLVQATDNPAHKAQHRVRTLLQQPRLRQPPG